MPQDNDTRLHIDAQFAVSDQREEVTATFGPFSDRSLAEHALMEVMRRADVRGAIIRDPNA